MFSSMESSSVRSGRVRDDEYGLLCTSTYSIVVTCVIPGGRAHAPDRGEHLALIARAHFHDKVVRARGDGHQGRVVELGEGAGDALGRVVHVGGQVAGACAAPGPRGPPPRSR